ncbi:glycosyltransferase domain-containing protein [Plantactinospora soyae]|uniref:PLOD1-3-like GT domain-containing protein n=1 Tax=Plantactinospora soyae TaxID=1544732 RepID=A0A927QYQ7_9ACTN|nr:glycosyltransferase domain-containing protein [Plantactinospora soyae]MBE1489495.1 hypothetical protein [Plantactinospora soyae]
MKVVTIATDLENAFLKRLLTTSCEAVGLDLVILHVDKEAFKFKDKRTALTRYLAQCPRSDELIVFTDAYDTLFLRGEQYIRTAYEGFAQKVVFSAEPNSWPLGAIGFALQESPPARPYPYLNSGGFIGSVGDILALCAKYPKPPSDRFPLLRHLRGHDYDTDKRFGFSDQYYWTLVRLLEAETVGLDNTARLFEYLGPAVGDVWDPNIKIGIKDFFARGKEAASYQRERERLVARLQSPSDAAQVHFASIITKAVALDLFDEGRLPDWLGGFRGATGSDRPATEVVHVGSWPNAT